jgi:hypothetical protein
MVRRRDLRARHRPYVEIGDEGKFVVIDIDTGAYEIDTAELAAVIDTGLDGFLNLASYANREPEKHCKTAF